MCYKIRVLNNGTDFLFTLRANTTVPNGNFAPNHHYSINLDSQFIYGSPRWQKRPQSRDQQFWYKTF